jgi:hypothetical protein
MSRNFIHGDLKSIEQAKTSNIVLLLYYVLYYLLYCNFKTYDAYLALGFRINYR